MGFVEIDRVDSVLKDRELPLRSEGIGFLCEIKFAPAKFIVHGVLPAATHGGRTR